MLVVLSDLHLEYDPHLGRLNPEPRSWRLFFEQLAKAARLKAAKELIVVFAGDLFELVRHPLWLEESEEGGVVKPYVDGPVEDGLPDNVEERLGRVFESILAQPRVRPFVELVQAVSRGEDDIFTDCPRPRFLFLPGTSDRLVNLSPALNRHIRGIFGMPHADDPKPPPLPHRVLFAPALEDSDPLASAFLDLETEALDYGVAVQHGHEYDWLACEHNYDEPPLNRLPGRDDEWLYDLSPLAEWIALDLVAGLAHRFLQDCGGIYEKLIAENKFIYDVLVGARDLRPQLRVLSYLRWRLEGDPWVQVRDTIRNHLLEAADSPYLKRWLDRHDQRWVPDRADRIAAAIGFLKRLSSALPDSLLASLSRKAASRAGADAPSMEVIGKDPFWRNPRVHFLCHGHYHEPGVRPLGTLEGVPKVAVCTGTWRRRHSQAADEWSHVAFRSMGYAIFYRPDEQAGDLGHRLEFWQGQVLTHEAL